MIEFMKQNKLFSFYSILVVLVVLTALFAPALAPQDPFHADMRNALAEPSAEHFLGTDKLGRDTLSRVIYGAQTSLFMTLLVVMLMSAVGAFVGVIAAYFGGKVELIFMRIVDMMLAFPGVVLAIAIAGILGGSVVNAILALVVVGWAKYARLARSLVLQIKDADYVAAARLGGASPAVILRRHIMPNILPMIVISASMDIGAMMMELAGLSFLGFGAQPPIPEWGLMLNEGRQYIQSAPWLMVYPGAAIFAVVAIFNLWGDGLRDVLDPKTQKS